MLRISEKEIINSTIALPGKNTTANLLFSFAFPEAMKKQFTIFSGIEDAVLSGKTELGVIIHENRFTYQQRGLHKVMDLGEYWEQQTQYPIPLGGIVIKRKIDNALQKKANVITSKDVFNAVVLCANILYLIY